jgi:hypothetical protein
VNLSPALEEMMPGTSPACVDTQVHRHEGKAHLITVHSLPPKVLVLGQSLDISLQAFAVYGHALLRYNSTKCAPQTVLLC